MPRASRKDRSLYHARKPGVVSGAPRSETNTNGEPSLSRRCLRSARGSRSGGALYRRAAGKRETKKRQPLVPLPNSRME
jgi:hypothetical protein